MRGIKPGWVGAGAGGEGTGLDRVVVVVGAAVVGGVVVVAAIEVDVGAVEPMTTLLVASEPVDEEHPAASTTAATTINTRRLWVIRSSLVQSAGAHKLQPVANRWDPAGC